MVETVDGRLNLGEKFGAPLPLSSAAAIHVPKSKDNHKKINSCTYCFRICKKERWDERVESRGTQCNTCQHVVER